METIRNDEEVFGFDEFQDQIGEVEVSDFEEKEFNLESIGILGTSLCIDQDLSYFYSDDGLFIEIPNNDLPAISTIVDGMVIIKGDEDSVLRVTEDRYKIILEALNLFK